VATSLTRRAHWILQAEVSYLDVPTTPATGHRANELTNVKKTQPNRNIVKLNIQMKPQYLTYVNL